MALSPGTRVGVYEITGLVGAGGMGEVYRARDTKLGRDVALKILPDAFATDTERLARFQREARTLASLNHPHIAQIHGIEENESTTALIMELVEGEDLGQRLTQGAMPLGEVLPIAKQLASAIEAAHGQGVIHRDLKPANIKVRPDGTVKVLDFGLAKATDPSATNSNVSVSPTLSLHATQAGIILGTAAYMSPEQARGKALDARTDIWSFGVVVFEMLAGRRPFDGEEISDTLASILKSEPSWQALPSDTPPAVQRLLRRCLQKDRQQRLQHAGDARLDLEDAERGSPAEAAATRAAPRPRERVLWGAAVLILAIAAAAAGRWSVTDSPPAAPIRFVVTPPEGEVFSVEQSFLAISPDGRRLAFITGGQRSDNRLWVRALDSQTAEVIPDTKGALSPVWAPDSRSIAFTATVASIGTVGRLRRVNLGGGAAVTLAEEGTPGAWSRDGVILFTGRDGRVYRVADTGAGQAVPVTELNSDQQETRHQAEFFLADGRRFVFQARNTLGSKRALYLATLDSPVRTLLLENASTLAYAKGHLLYQRDRTLLAQPFDLASGSLTGDATPVVEDLDNGGVTGRGAYSISTDGVLAYRTGVRTDSSRLTWFGSDGKSRESLALEGSYQIARRPSLSPDGQQLAVTRLEGQGKSDVWIIDLARNVPTRLTFDGVSETPVWSLDGARVVFTSNRDGAGDLYVRNAGGAVGEDQPLYRSADRKQAHAFSPDGKFLLFGQAPKGNPEIWAVALDGDGKAMPIVQTAFPAGNTVFSPDGRWFAYCEGDSGTGDQIYAQPFPPTGLRIRLSPTTGSSPQWSEDGKSVVFATSDNRIVKVEVHPEDPKLRPGTPQNLFDAPATFTHRAVLLDSPRSRLLLPVSRQEIVAPGINVVVNWLADPNRPVRQP